MSLVLCIRKSKTLVKLPAVTRDDKVFSRTSGLAGFLAQRRVRLALKMFVHSFINREDTWKLCLSSGLVVEQSTTHTNRRMTLDFGSADGGFSLVLVRSWSSIEIPVEGDQAVVTEQTT